MDDLWSNLEDYVADKISNDLTDADFISRDDVLAEFEDAFYDMIADYDFSQQFDYYMEGYDFSQLVTDAVRYEAIQKIWDELERRSFKGRVKRVADWFGKLTRKVHWYMPRR